MTDAPIPDPLFEDMDLPAGALPLGMIRVLRYFDADGNEDLSIKFDGDQSLTNTVGMIELAKNLYLRDFARNDDAS